LVVLLAIGFAIQQNRSAERLREEQVKTNTALKNLAIANLSLEAANRQVREREKDAIAARDEAKRQRDEARLNAYVAHVNLAQREWNETNVAHAQELLDNPEEAEFRGFEWYYLKRIYFPEQPMLEGHTNRVVSVAFSPDGK